MNVDQLVMSLLTAGSECVEMRSMYEKNPWNKAIQERGGFMAFGTEPETSISGDMAETRSMAY